MPTGPEWCWAVVLGGGAVAVHGMGRPVAAVVMAIVVVVNTAVAETLRRGGPTAPAGPRDATGPAESRSPESGRSPPERVRAGRRIRPGTR
ncbi:hypothetical protein ACICHK_04640 [Streptomyces sp. AHU1]|uniref:hypothetical protein n=1 Tax=Streptomyces sp. AHU1 TaxID=3377215 RepID=UPI003877A85D